MGLGRRAAEFGLCGVVTGTATPEGVRHSPSEGILDLSGRTALRELMGLLGIATVFVGIDSGVLHLAAAMGTPCVALFGPTDPQQTGPQGSGHVIVRARATGPGPMTEIEVGRVLEAVGMVMARSG